MDRQIMHIGIAGWAVSREQTERFGAGASHLARYATRFNCVEINSSFYRPHRPATYARWAAATPSTFRFVVKMPRTVTHEQHLIDRSEPLARFFDEVTALGEKLGPVLAQFPPRLIYDAKLADPFWRDVRTRFKGNVVCEPRHPSWFTPEAATLLRAWNITRVAADPAPVAHADEQYGRPSVRYLRLHGAPRVYYDAYDDNKLKQLAHTLGVFAKQTPVWCVFDNTAAGAAIPNAFRLLELMRDEVEGR